MKWKSTALGEVMRHRKGSITIDDTTSYKLCRVQLHRRGVVLRQNLTGAAISTKKQQVCKAGDFLVAEMDAKVGGYGFVPAELDGAIVSSHYYLFEVDSEKLHPEYLEVVSQAEILQQQIVAKGSTNYSSIRPGSVLEWQIPLPEDLEVQKQIARNFRAVQSKLSVVCAEITQQQSLLAKLKQAILQEAIQGKLTADWRAAHPDVEPASQLLHCIQAEKARLIAANKLRPEKPLPTITPAEIPFEIPKGWEWCWLGALIGLVSGQHIEASDYNEQRRGVPYLTGPSDFGVKHPTFTRWTEKPKVTACKGDLLVTVKGSGVGKMNVLHEDGVAIGRQLMAVRPYIVNEEFIASYLHSQYDALQEAKEGQIPGIGRDDILEKLIPLPPSLSKPPSWSVWRR